MHIVVLTPVLDDWVSAQEVLKRLDAACSGKAVTLSVLLVDDGSTELPPATFAQGPYSFLKQIDILRLKKNLGHQRAIAVGLCQAADKIPCDAVLVMDADGEDDPKDAARLIDRFIELDGTRNPAAPIIFAERTRRSESFVFQIGYLGYRALHYLFTGHGIRFGNFSIIPRSRLNALVTEPVLWNHYAASVAGSRLPHTTIPTNRGSRIAGQSRLNFVSLVTHGLAALSCYSELIGVRLILMSSCLFLLSLLGIILTLTLPAAATSDLPGGAYVLAGLLVIFLLQVVTLASIFTLQIIGNRSIQPFLPIRDYVWYVDRITGCFRRDS